MAAAPSKNFANKYYNEIMKEINGLSNTTKKNQYKKRMEKIETYKTSQKILNLEGINGELSGKAMFRIRKNLPVQLAKDPFKLSPKSSNNKRISGPIESPYGWGIKTKSSNAGNAGNRGNRGNAGNAGNADRGGKRRTHRKRKTHRK